MARSPRHDGRMVTDALMRALQRKPEGSDKKALQHLADKVVELAVNGDLRAVQFVAERVEGRPKTQTPDTSIDQETSFSALLKALDGVNRGIPESA